MAFGSGNISNSVPAYGVSNSMSGLESSPMTPSVDLRTQFGYIFGYLNEANANLCVALDAFTGASLSACDAKAGPARDIPNLGTLLEAITDVACRVNNQAIMVRNKVG